MHEFAGRTAVITGAASGIGLGIARRCGDRGMNVALLDIETDRLADAAAQVGSEDHVLALTVDVADPEQVRRAAAVVEERFGDVHLLVNNAGVSLTGRMWNMTDDDIAWQLGVNVAGVLHGVRAFVPSMMKHGQGGHVVSTASLAGLIPMVNASLYSGTKAAVVAMMESLLFDFQERGAEIGVSVLCPGVVNTNILWSERNRPANLAETLNRPTTETVAEFYRTSAADPYDVGERVLRAVETGDFFILTGEEARTDISARSAALERLAPPPAPRPEAILPDGATGQAGGIPRGS